MKLSSQVFELGCFSFGGLRVKEVSAETLVYTENLSCYKDSQQNETAIITDGESS